MDKIIRLFCSLAILTFLVTTGPSEGFAKRSSSSKSPKQKAQARGNAKKSSKSSRQESRHAKNRRSSRHSSTVAKHREKTASPTERDNDRPRLSASPSATPNQPRNGDVNSSSDQNSQDASGPLAPPAPRAVISSIPTERVAEIQTALIKHGYLEGEATGVYDDSTKAAMKKFQTANNLQASGLPSAHALKKLGVSKHGNTLNQVPVKTKSDGDKQPQQE